MNKANQNFPGNYFGEQRLNDVSQFSMLLPGVSLADMANPAQTIQRLRQRIRELEYELMAQKQ